MSEISFLTRPGGARLAYQKAERREAAGAGPTLVFLPGYKSDMAGSKATMLFDEAAVRGRAALLFDYAGCGASGGAFEEQTLESWCDDALFLIDELTDGPLLLAGSSMGGWLMLLAALALIERDGGDRVAGLVGIAAAPDFTDWGFDEAQRALLATGETLYEDSDYGLEPTPTAAAFWRSGQANLLLNDKIAIDCPVRLLHGQADADVPHETSLRLAAALRSADVQTLLIKDGDHRLSRGADLALLAATVDRLIEDRGRTAA
ncbi:alpha/beta hydrolase [Novosphingopyxis sp.]|uniref:alpha/beta hydrolase n=1 Tax=Novosphingopyxis sp. TaxID=2709690 RepID=UPI003B5AE91F